MNELQLLYSGLVVGAILFTVGLCGFLSRRNMIVMFLCAEMMLQGVSVSLVAWGRWHGDWGGQILVVFILAVAACEAAIALALVQMLFHRSGSLDMVFWQSLREPGQPAYVDERLPPPDEDDPTQWPRLTPAGIEPPVREDEVIHRSHV
jgi:NADH-quinone oxidoreductase subunit K